MAAELNSKQRNALEAGDFNAREGLTLSLRASKAFFYALPPEKSEVEIFLKAQKTGTERR